MRFMIGDNVYVPSPSSSVDGWVDGFDGTIVGIGSVDGEEVVTVCDDDGNRFDVYLEVLEQ